VVYTVRKEIPSLTAGGKPQVKREGGEYKTKKKSLFKVEAERSPLYAGLKKLRRLPESS